MNSITTGQTVERVKHAENNGNTTVHKETVVQEDLVDQKEYILAKVNQVIWFGIHVVGIILALRFVFLLLGANLRGIALFIYNISAPLVAPFQGIFPAPRAGGAYFDSASLLAIALWYIFGYIASYVLKLISKDVSVEEP